jgi:hypothetical protein
VYCTNPHTAQELKAETEAIAEEITGENFVIRLQMRFHSHNISFSALENYKYTIH